jgi:hypothetical protein
MRCPRPAGDLANFTRGQRCSVPIDRYRGTMRGKSVSGFAFYERSLALYRDWELAEVMSREQT